MPLTQVQEKQNKPKNLNDIWKNEQENVRNFKIYFTLRLTQNINSGII